MKEYLKSWPEGSVQGLISNVCHRPDAGEVIPFPEQFSILISESRPLAKKRQETGLTARCSVIGGSGWHSDTERCIPLSVEPF